DFARQSVRAGGRRRRLRRIVLGRAGSGENEEDEERENTLKNHGSSDIAQASLGTGVRQPQSPRGWNAASLYGTHATGKSHAAFRDPPSLRPVPGALAFRQRHAGRRWAPHHLLGAKWQS